MVIHSSSIQLGALEFRHVCQPETGTNGKPLGKGGKFTCVRLTPHFAATGSEMPSLEPPSAMHEHDATRSNHCCTERFWHCQCRLCTMEPKSSERDVPFTIANKTPKLSISATKDLS